MSKYTRGFDMMVEILLVNCKNLPSIKIFEGKEAEWDQVSAF
jgi:hypothetical protein